MMIFMYELDLEILKMYPHTKNELSRSRLSKVRAIQTDRRTDGQDRRNWKGHQWLPIVATGSILCLSFRTNRRRESISKRVNNATQ